MLIKSKIGSLRFKLAFENFEQNQNQFVSNDEIGIVIKIDIILVQEFFKCLKLILTLSGFNLLILLEKNSSLFLCKKILTYS